MASWAAWDSLPCSVRKRRRPPLSWMEHSERRRRPASPFVLAAANCSRYCPGDPEDPLEDLLAPTWPDSLAGAAFLSLRVAGREHWAVAGAEAVVRCQEEAAEVHQVESTAAGTWAGREGREATESGCREAQALLPAEAPEDRQRKAPEVLAVVAAAVGLQIPDPGLSWSAARAEGAAVAVVAAAAVVEGEVADVESQEYWMDTGVAAAAVVVAAPVLGERAPFRTGFRADNQTEEGERHRRRSPTSKWAALTEAAETADYGEEGSLPSAAAAAAERSWRKADPWGRTPKTGACC